MCMIYNDKQLKFFSTFAKRLPSFLVFQSLLALEALNELDELMVQPVEHKQYGRGVNSRDSESRNTVKFNIVKLDICKPTYF